MQLIPTYEERQAKDQYWYRNHSSNREQAKQFILNVLKYRTGGSITTQAIAAHAAFWNIYYKTTIMRAIKELLQEKQITKVGNLHNGIIYLNKE